MDQDLKQQLDKIEKFLMEHMVTKEEFSEHKTQVAEIKDSVRKLTDAVEGLATLVKKYTDEHTTLKHQIMVMQDWIRKASEKLGIEFKL